MFSDQNKNTQPPIKDPMPAMQYLIKAFEYCWTNRKDLTALAFLPVTVLALSNTLIAHLYPAPIISLTENQQDFDINHYRLLSVPISLILQSMFSVALFRYFLLHEENISIYSALKWNHHKTRFLIRFLQILGIFALISFASFTLMGLLSGANIGSISGLHIIGFFLLFLVLYAKLMMTLPAAAIGEEMSLKKSWEISTGNIWRIVAITALPFIPITIASIIIGNIMTGFFSLEQIVDSLTLKTIYNFVTEFLSYIYVAVMTVAIGYAYQYLTDDT